MGGYEGEERVADGMERHALEDFRGPDCCVGFQGESGYENKTEEGCGLHGGAVDGLEAVEGERGVLLVL